jgi:hypothetical protein
MAGNEEKNGKRPTPVRSNKPKLQRRPLTQTTGDGSSTRWTQSTVFDPTDEDSIPMSLQTISDPLPAGFVLSEKTLNMNNFLAAIEKGLRSKTTPEMQLEGRTTSASQQLSEEFNPCVVPGRSTSGSKTA